MQLKVYSIYDNAAKAFMPPFYMQSDAVAIRGFSDEINKPDSHLGQHCSDFYLYCLGDFEDSRGVFMNAIRLLVNGSNLKKDYDGPLPSSVTFQADLEDFTN